jgi:hypothetical protein
VETWRGFHAACRGIRFRRRLGNLLLHVSPSSRKTASVLKQAFHSRISNEFVGDCDPAFFETDQQRVGDDQRTRLFEAYFYYFGTISMKKMTVFPLPAGS